MSDSVKPNEIEKKLVELSELQDRLENAKAILKHYKIKSERLTQLKQAKKELNQQIDDEKKLIEDEFLEDSDYENARNTELTTKNEIKEKNAELRQVMERANPNDQLATYDYNIKNVPVKLQLERRVTIYINGKEAK